MTRGITALLLALVLLGSCSGDPEPGATIDPSASPATASSPTAKPSAFPADEADIAVSSPENGSTVTGNRVTIETEVTGFKLADKIGEKAAQGEGHIVFYMGSGYTVPTALGQPATSGGGGQFTAYSGADTSYTWENVSPGTVTFRVQLVNNDRTPLDPPQVEETTVTVRP
jgi:hypothetical protein